MITTILFWVGLLALLFFGRWLERPVLWLVDRAIFVCRPITRIASIALGVLVVAAAPAYLALWVWG